MPHRHSAGHISQTLDGNKIKEMILDVKSSGATSIKTTSGSFGVLLLGGIHQGYLFCSLGHCKQTAVGSEGGIQSRPQLRGETPTCDGFTLQQAND